MTTLAIRQQLHNYLEVAGDKKIKAIYTMMEAEIKERAVEYTDDFKAELDRRQHAYKSAKAKIDRKSTRLNSSHVVTSRMPSSA